MYCKMLRLCSRNFSTGAVLGQSPKTGVVMLNMGGPERVDQVHDYLKGIMTDTDMIQLPFRKMGEWIAKRRTPEVQKKYQEIGGGSPILKWTKKQGELMCEKLNKVCESEGPFKSYVGFRYVTPFFSESFEEAKRDGVNNLILFSQYPQYSCATSGSSFNQVYDHFRGQKVPNGMKMSVIDRWSTHPLLIKTFAQLIKAQLEKFPKEMRSSVIILFSAHSLPLKAVNRGDTYPYEVGSTVQSVMNELKFSNPYHLVWQSKVGPLPWLGPFTDDSLKAYVKKGFKNFVLVPIAFVNEHIETLHELDIEYCHELGKEIGVERIERCPAPNDHPLFIDALVDVVKNHLQEKVPVSPKFLNRCPHCTNKRCGQAKKWFKDNCAC